MSDEANPPRLSRQLAPPFLDYYRVQFLATNNPIFAFEAYRLVRAAGLEIPEWILELLDRWGDVIFVNCPTGGGRSPTR